jgi:hypothetical protein
MEYDERADELEREADRLEHESKKLEEEIREGKSDWEGKQSGSQAPGAVDAEGAGPHNIEDPDPATGRRYGQEDRREEFESATGQGGDEEQDSE